MRDMRKGDEQMELREKRDAGETSVREIMTRTRAQVKLVRRLSERMREEQAGPRSPRLTGMPKGSGGAARGLDMQVMRQDALQRIMERETALCRKYEREAREQMDRMRPELYAFCAIYYIGGLRLEDTAEALERSMRQCQRYKMEVEGRQETA